MPLLDDILAWTSTALTTWQRDAVRRLFQKEGKLSNQDYDDLHAMLRSAHGLPDPKNRKPVPLSKDHLPANVSKTTPVVLLAMRDLKHVNRIAPAQKLEFAPKGITVIYGGNGSGKSGYFRVLKRACRARDLAETVHADAFDPNAGSKVPEATFDIEVGGQPRTLIWTRGITPPDELSTIAVFDKRCARAYLDNEQDVAYLPYGLDIVENLGQLVLPELAQRLNAEIATVNTDTAPFVDLLGDTAVGKMIASVNANTDSKKVTALATLTAVETSRLSDLEKTLAENDPKAKAKVLRLSAQRIDGLVFRIDAAIVWVSDAAVEKLKTYDAEAESASKAEAVAAAYFRAGEALLPGTGEQAWKDLFEAARRFSIGVAYPGKPFPYVDSGGKCPLCQQSIDQVTAERLKRFDNFLKQDTAKVATEKREQRAKATQRIAGASLAFGLDAATTEELGQLDASLLQSTQEFERKVEARKAWLLDAVKAHAWDGARVLEDDPRVELKSLSTKFVAQATDLDKASDEKQKKVLEDERSELRARASLSLRLGSVLDLIQRMKLKAMLTSCKDDLKTKAISDKAKEFATQAVTTKLKNALKDEFRAIGVGHIMTKLTERVEKTKMKHKLVLDLPGTTKLDEILSEGEQRAIAIGSFLAELHLAGHGNGIVFDDPVSSLDHHRRKDVVRRLVEESRKRQVIILTHDTVFLGELRDAIDQNNVPHVVHHLECVDGHPGCVSVGLPWEHKSYKDRLDRLEKAQKALVKNWPPYPNEEDRGKMRHQYNFLRATIERVIQDVVLNGVVRRYEDWIRVGNLGAVVGFAEEEFKEIDRLHKACCDVVDAHDPSSAKNAPVPNVTQLGKDIADVKAVADTISERRKKGGSAAVTVV